MQKACPWGDLTQNQNKTKPVFVFKVAKDPRGNPIDKLQIVKGWLDKDGQTHEKVFTVEESETGNGTDSFFAIWVDDDFRNEQPAFYYARVLEVPSKRWTSFDKDRFGVLLDPQTPKNIRERAYSSPIWYSPEDM